MTCSVGFMLSLLARHCSAVFTPTNWSTSFSRFQSKTRRSRSSTLILMLSSSCLFASTSQATEVLLQKGFSKAHHSHSPWSHKNTKTLGMLSRKLVARWSVAEEVARSLYVRDQTEMGTLVKDISPIIRQRQERAF
ncbi:hypothetical protein BaRGS_00010331 [Batillaria attramentaria]|uniref:Uncharacterized protein n=1 Tax=Batillaria attramentaria TaxID=370345 RepID=A0ABD0LFZ5_9CAEN